MSDPLRSVAGDNVSQAREEGPHMIIDCDSCTVRGPAACGDCVVTALLGGPPSEIDDREREALAALAGSGLVPPLRLVLPVEVVLRHEHDPPPSTAEAG